MGHVLGKRSLVSRDIVQGVKLYVDDDIKQQQDIEPDEVKHGSIEMDGEIAGNPLRPRPFPLGQDAEGPGDRPEDGQHAQQYLLAVDGSPPADPEDGKAQEHHDLVKQADATGIVRRKIHQMHFLVGLLFLGGAVHAANDILLILLNLSLGRLILSRLGNDGVVHLVHRLLQLVIGFHDLHGLYLIHVMRPRADGIRHVCQHVEDSGAGGAARGAAIPEEHHGSNAEDLEDLQRVKGLALDHHLIRHACGHDDGKQRPKGHAELHDIPEGAAGVRTAGNKKLIGPEDNLVDLFLEKAHAKDLIKGVNSIK